MIQNPEQKGHFNLILAEVIFTTSHGIQILRRQMIEKSDVPTFNTRHLSMIQNRAAHEVVDSIPPEEREDVQVLDVFIVNISYLGEMTDEEFFGPPQEEAANEEVAVAANETDVPDNVTQFPGT